MPKKRNGEIPLPEGWDYGRDYDGKIYFIDHISKKTTWIDPRDRFTKPQTFADCIGNELPLGWEEGYDGQIGPYYINHTTQTTQLEDPRQEWRSVQEAMLREYLQTAQDVLEAKKDIYNVKSQRLILAQDEYNHLNNALATLSTSRSSLCSSGSGTSTKYDPDLLKQDVAIAKDRVSRLKTELEQIRNEMNFTQKGVDTLTCVEQKFNSHQGYNIVEAHAIMAELVNIQKSLSSGEKEKAELVLSLAKLKDDLTRLELSSSKESPDLSTCSLTAAQEKSSTASQTDLSCESLPIGTRLAEMARMRLEYDEARKTVQNIQQRLADLEEKVQPGQVESDKDRLLLFQEKEQLLRELRSITPRMRSKEEMSGIQLECKRLEKDLNKALEMSNRAIADRLRLHEEKQLLLQQLRDALKQMTHLESQLKTLSASTLSVSSSSSLGSLSTTSSKGSLNSGLSFTDIYGGPQCMDKPIDMADLHRRVERVLQVKYSNPSPQPSLSPRSSLDSVSPCADPMYENLPYSLSIPPPAYEHVKDNDRLCQRYSMEGEQLSPISESLAPDDASLSACTLSSGTNTRSVSAAVSDESVAGDSGVFEASSKTTKTIMDNDDDDETAQLQLRLRYQENEEILNVAVEKARNLNALSCAGNSQVYIKVALLPAVAPNVVVTKTIKDLGKSSYFGDSFSITVPVERICAKTLQLNVWVKTQEYEKCVGCTQVSLADFNVQKSTLKWYNILGLLMATDGQPIPTAKEESSDDSTIISSQTSTLTRNQDPLTAFGLVNNNNSNNVNLDEIYTCIHHDDSEDNSEESDINEEVEEEDALQVVDEEEDFITTTHEKVDVQTNTECSFHPEHAKHSKLVASGSGALLDDKGVIKRSQTFSPSAHVSKYICKLNRSDSDSAMPCYRKKLFDRNAVERRSLRHRRQSMAAAAAAVKVKHVQVFTTARTSVDLELDLQAQHVRLEVLHSELIRLRMLKLKLEEAKETGDGELATALLEDERFQNLMAHAEKYRQSKSVEEKRVDKMLRKVEKEIYKLRKTRAGNGKPDVISFREKMAFFTRVNSNVPFLSLETGPSSNEMNLLEQEAAAAAAASQNRERYEYIVDRVLGVEV